MERIEGQLVDEKELANQVLSWITCARRPLTTLELEHAIAIEIWESHLDKENLCQVEDMVSVCAGLVTVDEESGIVRLVHYTTQEYFELTQSRGFPKIETNITASCVTYMSFDVFESGFCRTDNEFEKRLKSLPFLVYASQNWGHHAWKISKLSQSFSQLVVDFLMSETKVIASSQALMAIKYTSTHVNYSQQFRPMTGLALTTYFGVVAPIKPLLITGMVDADSKDRTGRTPLSRAARLWHEAVVELLLNTGMVDAESKGKDGRTPLSHAAFMWNEAVVKLLLDTGKVNAESKDKDGQTPLSRAADMGHEAVVKLLQQYIQGRREIK
jgi:hypothetical protein